MIYFFNMDSVMGHRTARQRERASHTLVRALEARSEVPILPAGGSGADTPARAPRRFRSATRQPASGGDNNGDGEPAKPYAISAVSHEGITVRSSDGRAATLAVIDADGRVLAGDVAREAWSVSVQAYRSFLQGSGHLRVHASPPGLAKS